MSQQPYNQQQRTPEQLQQQEEINLREELEKYLRYWPWFLISIFISLSVAFLKLRYTTPIYKTTATIIIKDEENGGGMSELTAFADMGLFSGMGASSIENELGILRSKRLMTDVVKKLQLNIGYIKEGNIRASEVYAESPIEVQFLQLEERQMEKSRSFMIYGSKDGGFKLVNIANEEEVSAAFGEPVNLDFATIVINKISRDIIGNEEELPDFPLLISFTAVDNVATSYRQKVQLKLVDEYSSLIELTLNDPVKEKARDILDQLIYEYNRQAIEDKNLVARNTASFIEDRLAIITGELDSVETGKENFKEENQLTDIQAESEMFIENVSDFNKERQEVATQLELSNAMLDYLKTDKSSDLLPANLGITEEGVNSIISQYNKLVLERNRILSGSTEKNPVVKTLNSQLEQIRGNVLRSLQQMRSNLLIAQEELDQQAALMGSKIASVPGKEKQFRGIERQQNIKESLYLFLLQKREETNLSLAVTAPKAKVVDNAYSLAAPVSPKSKIILLAALILGVLIPFIIIYLKNLFNNKVRSQKDIERLARQIPIVGEIPRIKRKEKDLIAENDRSILAESFRILHTNLQYLLVNAGDKASGNTLFVASTVKGEGKTFVAFNLAITLANAGKKVIIVGADLRNPQLQRYEADAKNLIGVSDYLVNNSLILKEIIKKSSLNENLYLLASGTIPPNPSELWRRERAARLFEGLEEEYDYVIVDTAPAMLVTDTFLINKYADLTLYVVRSGYTEQKLLQFAVDARNEGKLHDVSFVLNDVELVNFGYGNKYGYAYGEETPNFWKKLKNKVS